MSRHLLDSDAAIDFLYGIPASVALLRQLVQQENRLCTCDVVNAEVFSGLDPSDRRRGWEFLSLTARGGTGVDAFYRGLGYTEVGRLPGAIRVAPGDDRDEILLTRRL